MGLLGRYIDSLPDTARDRIIRAQEWSAAGGAPTPCPPVDLAEGRAGPARRRPGRFARSWRRLARLARFGPRSYGRIRERFDRASRRFGEERVVRALKLHAAREYTPRGQGVLGPPR
ncbi:MAG: hypothetical protein AB1941_23845 [Gemmatimonadota bacterium]